MLPHDSERRIISNHTADLPFAPALGVGSPSLTRLEKVLDELHRWRLPLALVFGSLMLSAAYFAYQAQPGTSDANQAGLVPPPVSGGVPGAAAGSSTSASTTTAPSSTTSGRAGTSVAPGGPTTSRATTTSLPRATSTTRPVATSRATSTTRPVTTSRATSTRPVTTNPATSASSTTAATVPSTTAPTTSTTSTSPPPTPAPRPVFIGDRVTRDSWDGAGVDGVTVRLLIDADRNGVGERVVRETTTGGGGRYGFDADPGCYVVSFSGLPNGLQVIQGQENKALCLASGESDAKVDVVLGRLYVLKTPQSCEIQIGTGSSAGVEIQDSNGDFAPSYVFYGRSREVLRRTSEMGPPDDVERSSVEWTSSRYGYEESDVWYVAAESGGQVSGLALCQRRFT